MNRTLTRMLELQEDNTQGENDKTTPDSQAGSEEARVHFKVIRFLMEAGTKLAMKSVPVATAAVIYHRFFQQFKMDNYDNYLIATTALYLASKVEEEHIRIRDVINVTYKSLHPDRPSLDVGSMYFTLRESVVQCELHIMRMLQFRVSCDHPHKYLLHFIKSLYDWLDPGMIDKVPIAQTAWALLRDSYHGTLCLKHEPQDIAIAVLYMAVQCYGVDIPCSGMAEYPWWQALVSDIELNKIKEIVYELMALYGMETSAR